MQHIHSILISTSKGYCRSSTVVIHLCPGLSSYTIAPGPAYLLIKLFLIFSGWVGARGAGVPPPAGHYLSTGQLLQQQTDTPQVCEGEVSQVQVCEGEVSQVLPSCCCQTVQPALLHIDLTLYSALCNSLYKVISSPIFIIHI